MSTQLMTSGSRTSETVQTKRIPGEVVAYLRLHHVMTLSTSSFTGMPHADTVVFCNDDERIYFYLSEGTTVARNVADSVHVSFTIDDYTVTWRKVRELQGVGRCRRLRLEDEAALNVLNEAKFGPSFVRPSGIAFAVVPSEMHFVDYDYDLVSAEAAPDIHSRVYRIADAPPPPVEGPVATRLDRSVYQAGDVVFSPGDAVGAFFVVVEGEVEIRSEGHGADQTVLRLGPGQLFGDQARLRGQKGALTCHAVRPTTLLAVDRNAIRDLGRTDATAN